MFFFSKILVYFLNLFRKIKQKKMLVTILEKNLFLDINFFYLFKNHCLKYFNLATINGEKKPYSKKDKYSFFFRTRQAQHVYRKITRHYYNKRR